MQYKIIENIFSFFSEFVPEVYMDRWMNEWIEEVIDAVLNTTVYIMSAKWMNNVTEWSSLLLNF